MNIIRKTTVPLGEVVTIFHKDEWGSGYETICSWDSGNMVNEGLADHKYTQSRGEAIEGHDQIARKFAGKVKL